MRRKFKFGKKSDVVETYVKDMGAKFDWKALAEQIVFLVDV
jgi:hypothetical protein